MKGKLLSLIALVIVSVFAMINLASATSISWMEVYLNGHYVSEGDTFSVERGTLLSVRVLFETTSWIPSYTKEVKVKAWIDGYRKEIKAETERFDIYPGRMYSKSLFLNLPNDMEEGIYTLHVMITSNQQVPGESYKTYRLAIQRQNYNVEILSLDLALPAVVNAGERLNAIAVIKNRGSHKLEDLYVKAEIPELNMVKTIYIGDIYPYDYADNTERDTKVVNINFDIPKSAKTGTYTLIVKAYNDDVSKETSKIFEVIGVKETKDEKEEKEIVNIVAIEKTKKVNAGDKVEYTIVLTNLGDNLVNLEFKVEGLTGWATANFDKPIISLAPKSSQSVILTLNVDEKALEGSHIFSVQAISNGNIIATQTLIAEVEAKKVIRENIWIWIIIAILAIIALALLITLIVMLVKRKESEEKPEEIYY